MVLCFFLVHLDGIFDIQFEDFSGTSLARTGTKTNPQNGFRMGNFGQNPPPDFFDVAKSIYKKRHIVGESKEVGIKPRLWR